MNDIEQLREQIIALKEKVKRFKVLVVEDEDQIREKTGSFMERFFEKVDCAEDGKVALDMINKDISYYDVIITDLQMPNMTGQELIQELLCIDKDFFIVVMTGTPDFKNELIKECDISLAKPVSLEDMLNVMNILVNKENL